jgi:hypothetical protein
MKSSIRNLKRIVQLDRVRGSVESDTCYRIARIASSFGKSSAAIADIAWAISLRSTEASIYSFFRLAYRFSGKRFDAACKRVLFYGYDSLDMVKNVLLHGLDHLPLDRKTDIDGQSLLF